MTQAYFLQLPRCSHDEERKVERRARMVARVEMVVPCKRIAELATRRKATRVGRGDESDDEN